MTGQIAILQTIENTALQLFVLIVKQNLTEFREALKQVDKGHSDSLDAMLLHVYLPFLNSNMYDTYFRYLGLSASIS